jgi:outer membrane protein assembly factor BamB
VVNGVVYVGSIDFFALNASTRAQFWRSSFDGDLSSSPAVANGVVYVSALGGQVFALNASTGVKRWSFATGGHMESSPTVANGVVYVGSDAFDVRGNVVGGNVYALNASTGAKLWSFATGSPVESSPAVVNGVVYVGSDDKNVYALNASTGAKLWSYPTGGVVGSSPAVANGVVYVGSDDSNVYALNASTGVKLWSFATGGIVSSSPAVANEVVYVASNDGNVYALNASTGAKLWSNNTGGGVGSSPAVANGVVYVVDRTDTLYALNASTGAKLFSYPSVNFRVNSTVQISPPIVADGVVYISALSSNNIDGIPGIGANLYAFSVGADLFLRVQPSATTVHQGDLITYAFPVWNLGPANADHEVLNTQVPVGTTFDYIRISGTPGLGTCTHPPYQGTGQIVCHENGSMAPNTTWTVRLTVRVTAPPGTVITENAATMADTLDPNLANNKATVSVKVQ